MDYARGIRICRAIRGSNRKELAHDLGVNPSYISYLESGKRIPSAKMLVKLADIFVIPLHTLIVMCNEAHEIKGVEMRDLMRVGYSLLQFITKTPRTAR